MVIPKIKMRLSAKFILFTSMLIVLTSMVFSIFFIKNEASHIKIDLENKGKYLARNLAYNSEYGVLIDYKKDLYKFINGVVKEEDVVYAIIQDEYGKILAQAETVQATEIPEATRKNIVTKALESDKTLVQYYKVKKKSFYDIASPIITRQMEKGKEEIVLFPDEILLFPDEMEEKGIERKIGVARIGMSLASMNEQIFRVQEIIILLTLTVISLVIIVTILFIRRFVKPIKQLVLGTERIANGDLNQTVEIKSEDEIGDLARSFNQMAASLREYIEEKGRLFDEVNQRLKELSSLQEVSAAVVGELELESVLHLIAEKASNLTNSETASVSLISDDNQKQTHVASYGVNADILQDKTLSIDEGQHGWVIRTGKPLLSHDCPEDERISSLGRKIGAWSDIIVPLKVKGKIIGCLIAINKREKQHFTEEDLSLLTLFANQAGIAIDNAWLYQQQKSISEKLQQSYALLEQKNKELESFVYTVSHDLKAPLVSLEGFSSMLLDKYKERALDKTGQLYLSRIQANVQKMGELIQDLLDLSRIGRVVYGYESVNVKEIIKEAIETLEIQLSERGTELIIHQDLPKITCDRVRIKQVFANLISNANKFMGEANQKPRIEIGFHDKEDFFEFFVKDNGIGIQKKYHEKVFEIFTRLGDIEAEGTGVGLSIVKRIIEIHEGKIWLDSELGKGTTVYFTLPKSSQSYFENRSNLRGG